MTATRRWIIGRTADSDLIVKHPVLSGFTSLKSRPKWPTRPNIRLAATHQQAMSKQGMLSWAQEE